MAGVDWIGFCLASVAVVLAPGPGSMLVAKTAAASRVRAGLRAVLGIMVGDACLITLSLLGASALFAAHPSLFQAVRLAGAAYLVFLGLQAILARPASDSLGAPGHSAPFRRAVSVTLLNPKAVFFFMAFFPVFIRSTADGLFFAYAAMTLVFMAISGAYLTLVVHASSRVASAFQQSRTLQSVARKVCGLVFIGFGLKVAAASR